MGDRADEIALEVSDAGKRFGATQALDGVSLQVRRGEIHALIGQNGSGKSTLIKLVSGYHDLDSGSIALGSARLATHGHYERGRAREIAILHQDAPVAPDMTVLENMLIARDLTRPLRRLAWARERARARELLDSVGLDVAPDTPARKLSQAQRALLGFVIAVQGLPGDGTGLLILDEPTSSLPPAGVRMLFSAIRRLAARGTAVLFVTHRLAEVMELSSAVTVLREGRAVARLQTDKTDIDSLIAAMIGRPLGEMYPEPDRAAAGEVFRAEGLTGGQLRRVGFTVRRGEVLGITGLVGMGQDELPYLVYGLERAEAGRVLIGGLPVDKVTPRSLLRAGVALVPAERAVRSGVMAATVTENLTLPSLARFTALGVLRARRERRFAREVVSTYDVRPRDPTLPLGNLSGGNQQKVLLAKWIERRPAVLMLHEPTLGVDVEAKSQIFRLIDTAAARGSGIIIASSEYADLANLCDRVIVMSYGCVVDVLTGAEMTEDSIVRSCSRAA